MKYLFIVLQIHDGERTHTHRVLHTTKCKNINFAAQYYAAHFWGESERDIDDTWTAWGGEIDIELEKVVELTEEKYNELHKLFYYGI